jgi:hypothetical protein
MSTGDLIIRILWNSSASKVTVYELHGRAQFSAREVSVTATTT